MLESLFGNRTIEQILFFLIKNESCYSSELARIFPMSLSTIQHSLDRLEQGGIVVGQLKGRTRVYTLNPRYPFQKELIAFLEAAYIAIPEKNRRKYFERDVRTRPRKRGKM